MIGAMAKKDVLSVERFQLSCLILKHKGTKYPQLLVLVRILFYPNLLWDLEVESSCYGHDHALSSCIEYYGRTYHRINYVHSPE